MAKGTGRGVRSKRSGASSGGRGRNGVSSVRAQDTAKAPVSLQEIYIADCIGIGHEGEGVSRVNGFTLFVHGALPGEKVKVRVTGLKKQYGFAELLEVVEPSPDRIQAPCPVYEECGGCQLQHLDYAAQLRLKRRMVADNLERIGKIRVAGYGVAGGDGAGAGADAGSLESGEAEDGGVVVHPTIGMDEPWQYRNKVQVPVGEQEGGLVAGFYAGGSHRIVDAERCLIRSEAADGIVQAVKGAARELGIPAYNAEKREGVLRHVIIKTGYRTGETMIVLVTAGPELPHGPELAERIAQTVPGVESVCHNVNDGAPGSVMGPRTTVLWGRDRIYDAIGDIRFAISAHSFYQVNPQQTEALYRKALDYAGLTGSETVIDAYCGVGTISLFLARRAKRVYGVEIVPEAVEDARRNAEMNGLANAEFAVGKAEKVLPAWREQGIRADVIVVDPPRKGCDAALLETIVAMRPQRVVYVSCNPSTLARDLRVLEDGGFRTVEVQPVDMFPWTAHVECVVGICRVDT